MDRVWNVVQDALPTLKRALIDLLPPLDKLEQELLGEESEDAAKH